MSSVARRSRASGALSNAEAKNVVRFLRPSSRSRSLRVRTAPLLAPAPGEAPIPVLRPRLPKATDLLPYLQRIDESRVYSNWGPLVSELSKRLGIAFGGPAVNAVCANSGSSALVAAILACAGRARAERPIAIVPDFTFTATGLSAMLCGYEVVLANCHQSSWSFGPDDLLAHPDTLRRVGLVLPVAPFGRVVPQIPWLRFQRATGIPVVIDGAACFEHFLQTATLGLGPLPVAMSFHATKSFSTGEGGCVVTTDRALVSRVEQALNFGFIRSRNSESFAINGKMGEYAAAIGLASFDNWSASSEHALTLLRRYRRVFQELGIALPLWGAPDISSAYVLLQCRNGREARKVSAHLAAHGIDTRFWYGDGLSRHDVFGTCTKLDLHRREALEPRTLLGLPVAPDLRLAQIRRIGQAVADALR
jgi:dTDP-4-amino-4,6-dideoxygalactose transaminase